MFCSGSTRSIWTFIKQNEGEEGGEQFITAKLVSVMCNVDYATLQKMELSQYEVVVNQLSEVLQEQPKFQKFIELGGVKFGFIPKIDEISLGEYIDLEQYIKDPKDYHKAMGVLYQTCYYNCQGHILDRRIQS